MRFRVIPNFSEQFGSGPKPKRPPRSERPERKTMPVRSLQEPQGKHDKPKRPREV